MSARNTFFDFFTTEKPHEITEGSEVSENDFLCYLKFLCDLGVSVAKNQSMRKIKT